MDNDSSLVEDMLSLYKSYWCDVCTHTANKEDLASFDIAGYLAGDKDTAECLGFATGS